MHEIATFILWQTPLWSCIQQFTSLPHKAFVHTGVYCVLTALGMDTWPVYWNLRLGSVCHRWYCTLEILLVSVSAAFQRFVQVPETSGFNAHLMTGCRYCACRVLARQAFVAFVVSFIVLSIGVLVYEKTWTASHYDSIHLHEKRKKNTVHALWKLFTQLFMCHPRYHNIVLIAERMDGILGLDCLRFDRVRMHLTFPQWVV